MSPLERFAEAYWNAFRDGYARVGGDAREYPTWAQSNDPVKEETMRCLRHAVETLKNVPDGMFLTDEAEETYLASISYLFPGKPTLRKIKPTATDEKFARQQS